MANTAGATGATPPAVVTAIDAERYFCARFETPFASAVKIYPAPGDGNCLFHSIIIQIAFTCCPPDVPIPDVLRDDTVWADHPLYRHVQERLVRWFETSRRTDELPQALGHVRGRRFCLSAQLLRVLVATAHILHPDDAYVSALHGSMHSLARAGEADVDVQRELGWLAGTTRYPVGSPPWRRTVFQTLLSPWRYWGDEFAIRLLEHILGLQIAVLRLEPRQRPASEALPSLVRAQLGGDADGKGEGQCSGTVSLTLLRGPPQEDGYGVFVHFANGGAHYNALGYRAAHGWWPSAKRRRTVVGGDGARRAWPTRNFVSLPEAAGVFPTVAAVAVANELVAAPASLTTPPTLSPSPRVETRAPVPPSPFYTAPTSPWTLPGSPVYASSPPSPPGSPFSSAARARFSDR